MDIHFHCLLKLKRATFCFVAYTIINSKFSKRACRYSDPTMRGGEKFYNDEV